MSVALCNVRSDGYCPSHSRNTLCSAPYLPHPHPPHSISCHVCCAQHHCTAQVHWVGACRVPPRQRECLLVWLLSKLLLSASAHPPEACQQHRLLQCSTWHTSIPLIGVRGDEAHSSPGCCPGHQSSHVCLPFRHPCAAACPCLTCHAPTDACHHSCWHELACGAVSLIHHVGQASRHQ